jgi:hypothetical protein
MAAMLDSEAVFQARIRELGIPDADFVKLKAKGMTSLGRFAYITTIHPGSAADDGPFVQALVRALGLQDEGDLDLGSLAAYRRLWLEAYTVSIAEVRSRIERTDDTAPKKLPQPERNSKREAQQGRLPGIRIVGHLEPANCLIDFCFGLREDNVLQYVDPQKCVSRDQEMDGIKSEKFLKPDPSSGVVHEVTRAVQLFADLSSEYRVRQALMRRSLALDQVDLLVFDEQEKLHEYYFNLMSTEPLSSHQSVTMEQVLRADRLLWRKMAELTRDGIRPVVVGLIKTYPLKTALNLALLDPIVSSSMQPLQKSGGANPRPGPYESKGSGKTGKGGKAQGKGQSKNKGKDGKAPAKVPEELKGLRLQTNKGGRYCFGANLPAGCTFAKPGQTCKYGYHACMKCGKPDHGAANCPSK